VTPNGCNNYIRRVSFGNAITNSKALRNIDVPCWKLLGNVLCKNHFHVMSAKLWVLACVCRIGCKKSQPEATVCEIEIL